MLSIWTSLKICHIAELYISSLEMKSVHWVTFADGADQD